MTDIRHYRNGTLVNPRDFENLVIQMDWLNRKTEATINIEAITFVNDEGTALRERILSGLTGGVGFFEGEKYRLEVGDLGNPLAQFAGYLDFTDGVEFKGCSEVTCNLKREQGTDWLNEVADSFSYRYLYDKGIITDSDFVNIPYVINYIPDGVQLLLLAISTFTLTKELIESIQALSDRISDLTDAATPVVGVSAGLGAGVVTAYDIGNIIMAALKLVAQIAYIAAIVYALVQLIEQIIEQLMPPKRFHKGISISKLFTKACDYLGLKFSSDLIENEVSSWVFMPRKGNRGGEKPTGADASWRELGLPTLNSQLDTFAGVIRVFKQMFNADFKIVDGTFYFERRDKFRSNSPFIIPNTFTDQENLQDVNGFNTDEIKANYKISWSTDVQDQNTLANQQGRVFQAQLSPKVTVNKELTSLKGFTDISLPFALPVRKNELTFVEEVVKAFVTLADAITGQLGKPTSLSGQINNRIGSMHLSSHFTSVDKIVVISGNNLDVGQRDILSSQKLWDNYHFINSFAPIDVDGEEYHNQYWLYREQTIPFCFENFITLVKNNLVETQSGEKAEIETLQWNVWENKAVINYRVNRLYDRNFNITYL